MLTGSNLTTDQVLEAFSDAIVARGGRVSDTYNDGRRLWTRALLDRVDNVRRGDQVQGGVALKATEEEIRVYPYVFREVCSNGAIIAQTLGSTVVDAAETIEPEEVLASVREAVGVCCSAELFAGNVRQMRDATADQAITMLSLISRMTGLGRTDLLALIMEQFFREGDQTRFGLANAVTAVARETPDPELRWNLEELGGGIACGILPRTPSDRGRAARARSDELVGVG
jgi:hypothetical protein